MFLDRGCGGHDKRLGENNNKTTAVAAAAMSIIRPAGVSPMTRPKL